MARARSRGPEGPGKRKRRRRDDPREESRRSKAGKKSSRRPKPELPLDEEEDYHVPPDVAAAETLVEGMTGNPISDDDIFLAEDPPFAPSKPKKPKQAAKPRKKRKEPNQAWDENDRETGAISKPASGARKKKRAAPPREEKTRETEVIRKPVPGPVKKKSRKELVHQPEVIAARKKRKESTRRRAKDAGAPKPAVRREAPSRDEGTQEMSAKELAKRHAEIEGHGPARGKGGKRGKTDRARARKDTDRQEKQRGGTGRKPRSRTESRSRGDRKSRKRSVPDFAFRGSGLWLTLLAFPRYVFALAGLGCLALGAAVWVTKNPSVLDKVTFLSAGQVQSWLGRIPYDVAGLPVMPWSALGAAGLLFLLWVLLTAAIPGMRLRATYVYHNAFQYGESYVSQIVSGLLGWLIVLVTGGLGWPWVKAAAVRRRYRACSLKRAEGDVDFDGSGFQVLWLSILSILMAPAVLLTLGLFWPFLAVRWADWEQEHILLPTREGDVIRPSFSGATGQLVGKAVAWGLLCLLTAGLYRSFARVEYWTWIAENTELARETAEGEED